MKSKKFRFSMRKKFILLFVLILSLTIAGIAVANSILLGKLYESEKEVSLISAYRVINSFYSDDSDSSKLEMEKIYSTKNITIYIGDSDGNVIFKSSPNAEDMPPDAPQHWDDKKDKSSTPPPESAHRSRSQSEAGKTSSDSSNVAVSDEVASDEIVSDETASDEVASSETASDENVSDGAVADENADESGNDGTDSDSSGTKPEKPSNEPKHKSWPFLGFDKEKIDTGNYSIQEITDDRLGASFVQLSAKLDNGNLLYMRTPMAAVEEAASTANRLLIWIGIFAAIVGSLIVALGVNSATKPIRELTDIAGDMSVLNFSRKYKGKSRDEVDDLGASINIMSEKLEETILRLKEINAELEKDIELKTSIDKMRKEFIANASHELKTPLALISGYAEGLKDNIASDSETRSYYAGVIIDEAQLMNKVIKQLLTMAEIESTDVQAHKEKVDLSALVESSVRSFDLLAKREGYGIGINTEKGIVVDGDEMALTQAVNNYITNAMHHVDERRIIEVSLVRKDGKVRFSVFNSGKPIPDEGAERIWQSFGKLDKARTRAYGGSGLGLAIVKRSVELHGGSCGFKNTDEGVEFYFEIRERGTGQKHENN